MNMIIKYIVLLCIIDSISMKYAHRFIMLHIVHAYHHFV